jgi:class 3 adenylate cyclase
MAPSLFSRRGSREDEMRSVTALFADIVGSTGLGERLGPDEVKALVGECVSRMSGVVEDLGGMIQAYMGDGICAYFGVPQAHEDDPERAARAALRIQEIVGQYGREIEEAWGIGGFRVRVGVNTGPTAVGLVGAADPQTVALGDTTNVAARLQSAAEPGTTLVGETTARHLGGAFALASIGPVSVKGRAEAVPAWRLEGIAGQVPQRTLSPMVDRVAERERLSTVLRDVIAGRGQVLLLVGDTGLGKTRLLGELRRDAATAVSWLEGACLSWEPNATNGPFVQILRRWLGLTQSDPEVAVRTRLRARLGHLSISTSVVPSLGRLLSVRPDGEVQADLDAVAPADLLALIRSDYVRWIEALAARGPVVVAVEDVQWADPSARELLSDLLEATDRAPLLLVATLRPDPASEGWRFRLRAQSDFNHRLVDLSLGPLPDAAIEEMAASMIPYGLDSETKREIVARAEGNPLYVEQLVQALLEQGGDRRGGTWTLSLTAADLPPALEALLVARIDRLPEGPRRLAQVAAVVGRTFSVRVLERLAGPEGLEVEQDLAPLLRAGIVREVKRYPEFECSFQHVLLQEAALSTLTPTRRRELYGRVGSALEELHAGAIQEYLDTLAFVFYRSDDQGKALQYLERAAERAVGAGDVDGARQLQRRALKVAGALGDIAADHRLRALVPAEGQGPD